MVGTSTMACSLKYYLSLVMAITHEHNIILEQQIKLLLEVINKTVRDVGYSLEQTVLRLFLEVIKTG